jgi:hypothetical protein
MTNDLFASISRKFRRSLRKRGLLKTLLFLSGRAALLFFGYRRPPGISDFDRRYGTDTWREAKLNELAIDSPNVKFGIHYTTPPVALVTEAFSKLKIRHEDFTFIDMGSGKGMAMLLASSYPFVKIVGVEFSGKLIEIAKSNVGKYSDPGQKCKNFEFVHVDATEYPIPAVPLVIEFSNPFIKDVMRTVVDRLETSLRDSPREVWILYINPVEHQMFDESRLLTRYEHNVEYAVYRHLPQPGQ